MSTNKSRGNAYERKIARDLSIWMFDEPNMLRRKSDSGSTKYNYCGDVFPEGQLPTNWNRKFPFMIETKTGYKRNYPDFWSYKRVSDWMKKAHSEGKINNQFITYLICQFKNRTAFLITNWLIDPRIILFNVCFPYYTEEDTIDWAYVYFFNEVIKLEFNYIYNIQQLTK